MTPPPLSRSAIGSAARASSTGTCRSPQVLDESDAPFYRWFADGQLNACHNCLDRHVEAGLGERVALHWRGEEGEERDVTYAELLAEVHRLANVLKARGIGHGDVVGIYLPMIPEVVVAILACARIGAPHNVVFGGFAPEAVRERMAVSAAKALITVDGARRKGRTAPVKAEIDAAIADLDPLQTVVVVRHTGIDCPMTPGRDLAYREPLVAAGPHCPAQPVDAEHPLFILYSSGSTASRSRVPGWVLLSGCARRRSVSRKRGAPARL